MAGFWDFLSKISIVAIPVVLGWFLNVGSQRIADSIETRNFIQSMIEQLSDPSRKARQDIALILLNEYVGKEQPEMVAKIAEIVFDENMDQLVRKGNGDPLLEIQGSTAFEVLSELNPERAKQIRETTQQRVLAALLDEVNVRQVKSTGGVQ
ncbi:hypothetical protein [Meiothermus sp.]|uniref:hypothetical protein n=1 Tax=Meiothermus sp. TaxID=1955249 RepID=UPI00307D797B